MKGRFRKGKKSFRNGIASKTSVPYVIWNRKKLNGDRMSAKIWATCLTAALGVCQIQTIMAKPTPKYASGTDAKQQKAIAILDVAISTNETIQSILSEA